MRVTTKTTKFDCEGFTLIELMITIVVLGTFLGLAVPSLSEFYTKKRVISAAEAVYSHIQNARTESIARSDQMFFVIDGAGNYGSNVGATCDPTVTATGTAGACAIQIEGVDVLTREPIANFQDVTISGSVGQIVFDPRRGTATPAGIVTVAHQDDASLNLQVQVGLIGRVSICQGAGAVKIPGYTDCP